MRKEDLDMILHQILDSQKNVSDINITVGRGFQVESGGSLVPVNVTPSILSLTSYQTELMAMLLIQGSVQLTRTLLKTGSCDSSYQLADRARFRVNIFCQRGSYSIVLRKLSTVVPSIEEMGLPEVFYKMAEEKNGLILVTGPTGSGKSTTLASVLRYINEKMAVHVVTLEDPIEFEHKHQKGTFNQRELGIDFDSFANGLRAALRQAPKVILVGEMRDRETVEIGLSAAETGHLVMSTLHTINAGQTINRIVGLFDKEEQDMIRMRLAETIKWVACQRLLPKIGGGRVAAIEIMYRNLRTSELIAYGETEQKQFYDAIAAGSTYGMRTFDQHILSLFEGDWIDEKTALSYCTRKSVMSQGVDRIKGKRGESTSTLPDLEMQRNLDEELKKGKINQVEYYKLKKEEAAKEAGTMAPEITPEETPAVPEKKTIPEITNLQMESMVLNADGTTSKTMAPTSGSTTNATLPGGVSPASTLAKPTVGSRPGFPGAKPAFPTSAVPPGTLATAPSGTPTSAVPPPQGVPKKPNPPSTGQSSVWQELSDLKMDET